MYDAIKLLYNSLDIK